MFSVILILFNNLPLIYKFIICIVQNYCWYNINFVQFTTNIVWIPLNIVSVCSNFLDNYIPIPSNESITKPTNDNKKLNIKIARMVKREKLYFVEYNY